MKCGVCADAGMRNSSSWDKPPQRGTHMRHTALPDVAVRCLREVTDLSINAARRGDPKSRWSSTRCDLPGCAILRAAPRESTFGPRDPVFRFYHIKTTLKSPNGHSPIFRLYATLGHQPAHQWAGVRTLTKWYVQSLHLSIRVLHGILEGRGGLSTRGGWEA